MAKESDNGERKKLLQFNEQQGVSDQAADIGCVDVCEDVGRKLISD